MKKHLEPPGSISITEKPNELTLGLDMADPVDIVELFQHCDEQIFAGYNDLPSICSANVIGTVQQSIESLARLLRLGGDRKVVIAGAGTSGRLATLICTRFNRLLERYGHPPLFHALIAGGASALIKSVEGAEDDPAQGAKELKSVLGQRQAAAYIGVTCGLSAPYIAGQLEYCMDKENIDAILLGFNPIELARDVVGESWKKTFRQIARRLSEHPKGIILNPVVGPEALTGSTRMKGGTATKILLEIMLSGAVIFSGLVDKNDLAFQNNDIKLLIPSMLEQYRKAMLRTYAQREDIAALIKAAGQSLRQGGHIYYVGRGTYGALGLIDASECPPTFGADFEDVRGFVEGGWRSLLGPGQDLSHLGEEYSISLEDFRGQTIPNLSSSDMVLAVVGGSDLNVFAPLLGASKSNGATVAAVMINVDTPGDFETDITVSVELDNIEFLKHNTASGELAAKLVLNALSTGAHVLAGKVYENRMIDLRISNNKLYHRSLALIEELMSVDRLRAEEAVRRAIFSTDNLSSQQRGAQVSEMIRQATGRTGIVPLALLLSTGRFKTKEAVSALEMQPVVRSLISEHVEKSSESSL